MAYYGDVPITEAIGQFDGKLASFADGILGGKPRDPSMPGPDGAYRDGVLGRVQLWSVNRSARRRAALLHNAQRGVGQTDGELAAYADGVVGGPAWTGGEGLLAAYRDGSLGEYFSGIGEYVLAGIGATGEALDLTGPAAIRETKAAMALMVPGVALSQQGQATYTAGWYDSGIWDEAAAQLWFQAASELAAAVGHKTDHAVDPTSLTVMTDDPTRIYPNGAGIAAMVGMLTDSPDYGPAYVTANFPELAAFVSAGGQTVLPPFYSIEDKVRGESSGGPAMAGMSQMAMYGIGAAIAAGVVIAVSRRKRRS